MPARAQEGGGGEGEGEEGRGDEPRAANRRRENEAAEGDLGVASIRELYFISASDGVALQILASGNASQMC